MINIIKTAIITIIISFISGLLLDYYKNLAPRLLCNIGENIPVKINNKNIHAYIVTVKNISNKIIHDITLHVQSPKSSLKITDAKITKGLKFDSSIEDDVLDVNIPFLSNDDEFSVTLYVENEYGLNNKPAVIIRSPEKFKQVHSSDQKGVLSIFSNINNMIAKIMKKNRAVDSNKKGDFTRANNEVAYSSKTINKQRGKNIHNNNKLGKNKKAMIVVVSIILVVVIGALGKFYFKWNSTNTQTPNIKTDSTKKSSDIKGSSDGDTNNSDVKPSNGEKTKNTDRTNENMDTKSSTDGSTPNVDSNKSTDETNKNTDSNKSTGETNKNTDSNKSTSGENKNTNPDESTSGKTGSTDTKSSTDGTNKSTDVKPSTGETTGDTSK
ncbi:hypothetical protein [Clostridium sp. Marseille-Q2269]|uniref:hypothetical protein n=1 Tax=Clostridium sp. Marseille-Q2269 TaxID=2942205 RepID=UPI002073F94A|nr:hypothetical protein [Clostridium sp. Marseille-Q2269]